MKIVTLADKVNAMVKSLVKEFKSNKNSNCIDISGHFHEEYNPKTSQYEYEFVCGKKRIGFGKLSNRDYSDITYRVGDAVCQVISQKLKKNEVIHRDVDEQIIWSGYYETKYYTFNKIVIVRFCKDFIAINKKLVKLGCKEIDFKDWYIDYVSGKRSSIFDHDVHYYAESEKMCAKVLAFLKGKKKLSYEFFDDDNLENREYGERYETEWDGSMSRKIRFIDSKGKKTAIYGY